MEQINKLINNVIKINIKKSANFNDFYNSPAVFLLYDGTLTIDETEQTDNLTKIDRDKYFNTEILNAKFKFEGTSGDLTEPIKKTIITYFAEGGDNLYLMKATHDNKKLPDGVNFLVGINLFNDATNINAINTANADKRLIWITKPVSGANTPIFELTTPAATELHWLAHPAAYLNSLSLRSEIKDYCYTKTKTIIPSPTQEVNITNEQKWDKNQIINISNAGYFVGGEMNDGSNLTNEYVIELMRQRLQNVLIREIFNKPNKLEISGIIENRLRQELDNFLTINAIEPGAYNGGDKIVNYNGEAFTALKNGEQLNKGYKLFVIDINKQSKIDQDNHQMTPIYIYLSQQNQVRFIELTMEAI